MKNFAMPHLSNMADYISELAPHPTRCRRNFTHKLFLDNTFNRHAFYPQLFVPMGSGRVTDKLAGISNGFEVAFDSKRFDVLYLEHYMARYVEPNRKRASIEVLNLWEAVADAVRKHKDWQAAIAKARAEQRRQKKGALRKDAA